METVYLSSHLKGHLINYGRGSSSGRIEVKIGYPSYNWLWLQNFFLDFSYSIL